MPHTIAIIWWWAAWMMTAATLAEREDFQGRILLFEKNSRLGAKVIISGGGRCNVTTGICKKQELLKHYTRGAEFLDYAFTIFGPRKVRAWFEDHGVPLKEEEDRRVFPVSDDGKDIVGVFETLFLQKKVEIRYRESVQGIIPSVCSDGSCRGGFQITTAKETLLVSKVVLTTGGEAFSHTGSTGDGYAFARACGHTITPLGPSLNSFLTTEKWLHDLSGISFPHAVLKRNGKNIWPGPVLLTHFGISGPLTFVLASHSAFELVSKETPLSVSLQPDASMHYDHRDTFLKKAAVEEPKKYLKTILATKLTKRFVEALLKYVSMDPELYVSQLRKEDRTRLCHILGDGIPLTLLARRPGDEFVTAGGVSTDEVNPQTMESLITPWLYFAGELLNIDGVTGGFNLQASRATGRVVWLSI